MFVLLRDTVGIDNSTEESPDRAIISLFPRTASSMAPNGKRGKKKDSQGSAQQQLQKDQGLSRSS